MDIKKIIDNNLEEYSDSILDKIKNFIETKLNISTYNYEVDNKSYVLKKIINKKEGKIEYKAFIHSKEKLILIQQDTYEKEFLIKEFFDKKGALIKKEKRDINNDSLINEEIYENNKLIRKKQFSNNGYTETINSNGKMIVEIKEGDSCRRNYCNEFGIPELIGFITFNENIKNERIFRFTKLIIEKETHYKDNLVKYEKEINFENKIEKISHYHTNETLAYIFEKDCINNLEKEINYAYGKVLSIREKDINLNTEKLINFNDDLSINHIIKTDLNSNIGIWYDANNKIIGREIKVKEGNLYEYYDNELKEYCTKVNDTEVPFGKYLEICERYGIKKLSELIENFKEDSNVIKFSKEKKTIKNN